jgi:DUF4097 and DUF4098 domain-containing protein YvlB
MTATSIVCIRLAPALLVVLATATSCITNRYTATTTETIPVKHISATPIHVTTRNGTIEIVGGAEGPDIVIRATIKMCGMNQAEADDRLDHVTIQCDRDDQERLIVRAVFADKRRSRDGVSYLIRVPDADGAVLLTSNGSVKVRAIAGVLDIQSSNGKIEVDDHSGKVKARTSNGSITVQDVSGPVDVHTSNGGVTVNLRSDAPGPLAIQTSNGRVTVTVGEGFAGTIHARTSNGRFRFNNKTGLDVGKRLEKRSGSLQFPRQGNDSKIRSSNGSVTVTVE